MTQQMLDLHCVAIKLFQFRVWLVARRGSFIKNRPLLHPKSCRINTHTLLTRTFISATYLNPFLSIVSRPGHQVDAGCLRFLDNPLRHHMFLHRLTPIHLNLQELISLLHTILLTLICLTTVGRPLKLRLQPLLALPRHLLTQISTSISRVPSILQTPTTLTGLLVIVRTGLHCPQLPRWSTLQVNDDQSGLGVVTTVAFTVASLHPRFHVPRTQKVAADVNRVVPLPPKGEPRNKIRLDVTNRRRKP